VSPARALLSAAVAASLCATLAGCNGRSDADPTPSPSTSLSSADPSSAGPSSAPQDIDVAVYGDAARLSAYRQIADAFTAQHPDVRVTVHTAPDADTAAAQAIDALQLGAGPDVFLADQQNLPALVATGGLQPVDHLLENRGLQFGDDHQRVALTSMSADSRLQCMPAEMSPLVVYLNTRLVPRHQLADSGVVVPHGVDMTWSWQDFTTTARTVAGVDQLGPIKGVYLPPSIEDVTAFVRAAGGDVVDSDFEPTTLALGSDQALTAVDQLATLARDPAVSLTRDDLKSQDARDWFTSGDLGMYIGTRDDLPALRAAKGLHFDVAPLPGMGRAGSVSDVNGYCINAATDHLGLAADFIAFAVGEDGARIAARSNVIVPSRLDTIHEDAFLQPGEEPRNSQAFVTSIRRSEPMPYDTAWPRVSSMVEATVRRLFLNPNVDLDSVLETKLDRLDSRSQSMFDAG